MAKEPTVNTSEFDIGDYVAAKQFANFEHDFAGIVEKIYEHSMMIMIVDYDPKDAATVNEFNQRAIVPMETTKILKKTDHPAPRPSEDENADEGASSTDTAKEESSEDQKEKGK
ncbi:hypothetical protein [Weissella halotolerans]|uniref:DUF2187 domain-containing protein n=1 Tax=Weissella halotolerans DSM 20190 TaxID=1123500 RepID=A0A0R2FYQ5_9LACO|nr:hypothetical protein [Weissella halotolerans]KRN33312.1 hypothetical protein IV68_GL000110 [Weissella halotolerans DSM 20190]